MMSNAVARCLLTLLNRDWRGRTFDWHISNIVLMRHVERDLPKDRIFEIYLNETWFGRRSYGAAAAAKAYFGKSLSDLTLDEAADVAALPRAPYRVGRDSEYGITRRNFVIDRMAKAAAISPAQAELAKQQPLLLRQVPETR
jgi:penicillin-binding protein 1A